MDIEETLMLSAGGDELASKQLSESLYKELRDLAGLKMRSEERGHTLQPTALVNEALVRLLKSKKPTRERSHFLALAAMAMQRVLIDYGRKRRAKRRGGDWNRKSIEGMEPSSPAPPDQFSSLAEALLKLEHTGGTVCVVRHSRVLLCRYQRHTVVPSHIQHGTSH